MATPFLQILIQTQLGPIPKLGRHLPVTPWVLDLWMSPYFLWMQCGNLQKITHHILLFHNDASKKKRRITFGEVSQVSGCSPFVPWIVAPAPTGVCCAQLRSSGEICPLGCEAESRPEVSHEPHQIWYIHIHLRIYICMSVCLSVFLSVCLFVCLSMHACMHACMYVCINVM